jgi:photosystem II stability/assembly factor-like uncharacterized protein
MKKLLLLITLFTLLTQYTHTQWYRQSVPTNKSIVGIEFIDSLKGWAATGWGSTADTSYILYTSNGGTNWQIQFRFGGAFFESMDMVDANTGYVGGYSPLPGPGSVMFKTTNGGQNWVNLNIGVSLGFDDICFINRDSGYVCENTFNNLYVTTNGGTNWMLRNNGLTSNPFKLFFLNFSTGYCGADFTLYKTTNAGANWSLVSTFSESVKSIFLLNENTGWLGFGNNAIIRFTSNGGNNWITQPNAGFGGSITEIVFFNSQLGYAASGTIYIYKTYNGGQNWGYQIDTTGSQNISFIDTLRGWSGSAGISHTTNGGGPVTYLGINTISTEIPGKFTLYQNYPNPFNPVTKINFDIKTRSFIKLVVYDILGRIVNELVNEALNAGIYEYTFENENLPSGTYFYRMITANYTETRKMILIK